MRFAGRLGVVVLVGIVARTVYVVGVLRHVPPGLDATWYYLQAGIIRHEHAFADPGVFVVDRAATAAFPPLYPAFLALVQTLFGDSVRTSQLAGVVTGAITIMLVALIARRLAGDTVGLVAGALAALSPMLIAADGSMMSETVFVPLALATAYATMQAAASERWQPWIVPGVLAGLAALTRADGGLLLLLVVWPSAFFARPRWRPRLIRGGVASLAVLAVTLPWVVRNAVRLDTAQITTVSSATAIAGANCVQTYRGASLGSWEHACIHEERRAARSEVEWTAQIRREGVEYARDHPARVPVVVGARVARLWGVWAPADLVDRDAEESRHRTWQWIVTVTAPVVIGGGILGLWWLRRRRAPIAPLVGLLATSTAVAIVGYGNPRFRAISEPALLIGVAVVVVTLGASLRASTGGTHGQADSDRRLSGDRRR